MNIRPLYDRIVVKRIEQKEQIQGGIIIPDTAKEKPQEGEVVAVGQGKRLENGKVAALDVKPGDRILFGKYSGNEIKLGEILQGFENGPLRQLHEAIAAHDKSAFDTTYRTCVETCYSCHKASDKPFIRPQMPTQPESPMINFDPNAEWPQ